MTPQESSNPRGYAVARIFVCCTTVVVACVSVFAYTDRMPLEMRSAWLANASSWVASSLQAAFHPTRDFGSDLQAAFDTKLPEWAKAPRDRFMLHVVRSPAPLPSPDAPPFDWYVQEFWCNSIPEWSDYWSPHGRVSDAYLDFLAAIDDQTEAKFAQQTAQAFLTGLDDLAKARAETTHKKNDGKLDAHDWQLAMTRFKDHEDRLMESLKESLREVAARGPKETRRAMAVGGHTQMLIDESDNASTTPSCRTIPDLGHWLADASRNPPSLLAFGSTVFTSDQEVAGKSGGILVETDHGAQSSPSSLDGVAATVTLRVRKLDVILLDRRDWLDLAYTAEHKNGPWRPNTHSEFWGRYGSFPLLPHALIVAFNPSLEIQLSADGLKRFQEWSAKSGSSLVAGPFRFSNVGGQVLATEDPDPLKTVKLYSSANSALVVGVISTRMP